MAKEWFSSWFDSPYYHLLYNNRDDNEAERFIGAIVKHLGIAKNEKVLDLACGKGRHSKTLNKLGLDVLGVDLSPNSISFARQYESNKLKFAVHDMRQKIPNIQFRIILNLFTSFGYFDENSENIKMLESVHQMLLKDGILIIDFMNSTKVINGLVEVETKTVKDVEFNITRKFDGNHIFKSISFDSENGREIHTERVQALRYGDFDYLLSLTNFEILSTFGDFELNPFEEKSSDRLIIIARKK